MYKLKNVNLFISLFLLLSTQVYNVDAFSFKDSFSEMVGDMEHAFKRVHNGLRKEFKSRFRSQEKLSAEDQDLINKQLEIAQKIKPEITKNENGIISITFPIDNIDKAKIELSLEYGLLNGIIPLEYGYFRFIINPKFIRCEYLIQLTKEVSCESPTTEQATDKEIKNKEKSAYTLEWSNCFNEALPLEVDVTKAQSETKNNKLFIKLEPKSYERLKIRHA